MVRMFRAWKFFSENLFSIYSISAYKNSMSEVDSNQGPSDCKTATPGTQHISYWKLAAFMSNTII